MRLNKYTPATKAADDDYFVIDGDTNGTRSLPASVKADKATEVSVTLEVDDWVEDVDTDETECFSCEVAIAEIKADTLFHMGLAANSSLAIQTACASADIFTYEQRDGVIKLFAKNKPTVDLPATLAYWG